MTPREHVTRVGRSIGATEPLTVDQVLTRDHHFLPVPCRKSPSTYRIVVLGSSYPYGFGVSELHAMPAQLQEILNEDDAVDFSYEVLNVACPGFNVLAAHDLLVQRILPWVDFDLLIWCFSSDDGSPLTVWELARGSPAWRETWRGRWRADGIGARSLREALSAARTVIESSRARLLTVYFEPVGPDDDARRLLMDLTKDIGIDHCDLTDRYDGCDQRLMRLSPADKHPSVLAHRLAAAEVARWLSTVAAPPCRSGAAHPADAAAGAADRDGDSRLLLAHALWSGRMHHSSMPGLDVTNVVAAALQCARLAHATRIIGGAPLDHLSERLLRLERYLSIDPIERTPGKEEVARAVGVLASAADTAMRALSTMTDNVATQSDNGWPNAVRPLRDEFSETVSRAERLIEAVIVMTKRQRRRAVDSRSWDSLMKVMAACAEVAHRADAVQRLVLTNDPPSLKVGVRSEAVPRGSKVVIECVFSVIYPVRRRLRQSQYMIQDDTVRSYEFFLPRGCVAVPKVRVVVAPTDDGEFTDVPVVAPCAQMDDVDLPVNELWSLCAVGGGLWPAG
jgi:hypothetical protein